MTPTNFTIDSIRVKRRLTEAGWVASTVVLAQGEPGLAVDTGSVRFGDGTSTWVNLPSPLPGGLSNVDNTSDANKPLSTAQAAALALKAGKSDLVFNVKDFGAVGDGTTDDTTAIRAAITAATARGVRSTVLFPQGAGAGYRTTLTIAVPGLLDVDMRVPIIYDGPAGFTALTIGESGGLGSKAAARHRVRVRRSTLSTWLDETDVGVKLIGQYWSIIELAEIMNFTVGAQCLGDGYGFAYNNVFVGTIKDNKIGLDLTNANVGWCNQNSFFGGSWQCTSTTYQTLDRTAVRITSADAAYKNNNSNTFYSPSFEITGAGKPYLGLCVDVVHGGPGNRFLNVRNESCSPLTLRTANASLSVYMQVSYDSGVALTVSELGTFRGSIIDQEVTRVAREGRRLGFRVDGLHKKACYFSSVLVNVPELAVQTNATVVNDARSGSTGATGLTINDTYLAVGGNRLVGRYVSTRQNKRFTVTADADAGFGGRYSVRCHNAAGVVLTAAGTVATDNAGVFSGSTAFGGAFTTAVDATGMKHFTVGADVDYIFVGIRGGTAEARIRSLACYAIDGDAASWLPWVDNGRNYATEAPVAGAWEAGRRLYHAAPVASGVEGWICVVAGTPGTWKTFGAVGA